ncbi:hydrogenase small subunit [Hydrogenimonas urashimensis]|uniref:hydrogenase small subunit n=1 Tax=Hydrogenimonas urashimensis TaxID=2740515 RepID=UPI0019160211|nr:hydrogenase small subunit [Hydrogenimonas urashimensis]
MRIVIVGGGIAAAYAANAIMERQKGHDVLIVSAEKYPPYDRIHLCRLVEGRARVEDIRLDIHPGVRIELDQRIVSIDTKRKRVFSKNASFGYDRLLIATGSKPKELFDITSLENAATFRSADDAFKIAKGLKGRNAVIVGVGPIGLELLDTLIKLPDPKGIYLLSRGSHLYDRALNPTAVEWIAKTFETDPRVKISYHDEIVDKKIARNRLERIRTKHHSIDDPFLVFGIGIEPNIDFAKEALETDRGILVDETMRTSDPDIYAVGEAAQIRESGFIPGRVRECTREADIAVDNLLGLKKRVFEREPSIDGLKVGSFHFADVTSPLYDRRDEENEDIIIESKKEKRIDQYIVNHDLLRRFIGLNSNVDLMSLKRLMEKNEPIDPAFFYQSRKVGERGRLVCSCTGTYEKDLVDIIRENAVTCFADLKGLTEAGRVCGRCKQDIVDLIRQTKVDPKEAARIRAAKKAAEEAAEMERIRKRIEKFNRLHPRNKITSENLEEAIKALDMNREYNRWVSMITASMRLSPAHEELVDQALRQLNKIPIVWLELADCTGNSTAFIKTAQPKITDLILNYISLDYHELLMAAAGEQSESALESVIKEDENGYVLIVEGAVPLAMEGKFLRIGPKGETGADFLKRVAKGAAAVFAVGTCAFDGGVVAAAPNPTGAVGVSEALGRDDVINLPGCPVNPANVVGTLIYYIMFDEVPELDEKRRPKWAYSYRIHDNCERRGHYDLEEFVLEWGDEGAKKGWCLFKMGCKGPYADLNCPQVKFNEGTSWPVQAGHGCIACGEGKVAFDLYANERPLGEEENHG